MKKLEFYFILFGVGIGVFLSGVVINMTPTPYLEYTDEEIREKARELGMMGLRESIEENLESPSDDHDSKVKEDPEDSIDGLLEIAINRGDTTGTVSKNLEEAGVVDEALEFEKFVNSKGASNSLREGTYAIERESSFEDILNIITKGAF